MLVSLLTINMFYSLKEMQCLGKAYFDAEETSYRKLEIKYVSIKLESKYVSFFFEINAQYFN